MFLHHKFEKCWTIPLGFAGENFYYVQQTSSATKEGFRPTRLMRVKSDSFNFPSKSTQLKIYNISIDHFHSAILSRCGRYFFSIGEEFSDVPSGFRHFDDLYSTRKGSKVPPYSLFRTVQEVEEEQERIAQQFLLQRVQLKIVRLDLATTEITVFTSVELPNKLYCCIRNQLPSLFCRSSDIFMYIDYEHALDGGGTFLKIRGTRIFKVELSEKENTFIAQQQEWISSPPLNPDKHWSYGPPSNLQQRIGSQNNITMLPLSMEIDDICIFTINRDGVAHIFDGKIWSKCEPSSEKDSMLLRMGEHNEKNYGTLKKCQFFESNGRIFFVERCGFGTVSTRGRLHELTIDKENKLIGTHLICQFVEMPRAKEVAVSSQHFAYTATYQEDHPDFLDGYIRVLVPKNYIPSLQQIAFGVHNRKQWWNDSATAGNNVKDELEQSSDDLYLFSESPAVTDKLSTVKQSQRLISIQEREMVKQNGTVKVSKHPVPNGYKIAFGVHNRKQWWNDSATAGNNVKDELEQSSYFIRDQTQQENFQNKYVKRIANDEEVQNGYKIAFGVHNRKQWWNDSATAGNNVKDELEQSSYFIRDQTQQENFQNKYVKRIANDEEMALKANGRVQSHRWILSDLDRLGQNKDAILSFLDRHNIVSMDQSCPKCGTFSWMFNYPVDVIKTRFQADDTHKATCNPTLIRAFPTNAATFFTVEWTYRLLIDYDLFGKIFSSTLPDRTTQEYLPAACSSLFSPSTKPSPARRPLAREFIYQAMNYGIIHISVYYQKRAPP
uniref:Uncharacterized protein n=1 Tax=Ditylenchus dipsaci TaxID=166011 RepID=A0A915E1Y4_9BILA